MAYQDLKKEENCFCQELGFEMDSLVGQLHTASDCLQKQVHVEEEVRLIFNLVLIQQLYFIFSFISFITSIAEIDESFPNSADSAFLPDCTALFKLNSFPKRNPRV